MTGLLSLVAQPGVATALHDLAASDVTLLPRHQLADLMTDKGVLEAQDTIDRLLELRLLQLRGSSCGLSISRAGIRAALLLEALDGADIEDICRRLRRLAGVPERYELVRQGMTTRFIESLVHRPSFGRLYFCSPWINLSDKEAAILRYAVIKMQQQAVIEPEILVITRPPGDQPEAIRETGIRRFAGLGAKIHYLRRLHTKLYIREPNESGGNLMAIVGSENLTRSNNLELGIQISNDDGLIGQLIAHFFELLSYPPADEVVL